jgi:hypothetical protein
MRFERAAKPNRKYSHEFKHVQISNDDGQTLTINNVERTDAGHYWCQANNAVGSMSTDFELAVVEDPSQVTADEKYPKPIDSTVFQWFYNFLTYY